MVIDLSDPTTPTELGFYGHWKRFMIWSWPTDYIYVAGGESDPFILQFTRTTSDTTAN